MEAVSLDTLRDIAVGLAQEAKANYRRARALNQQAAAIRDQIEQLQSEEDKSE